MASVVLDRAYLNLADTPSSSISGFTSGRAETLTVPGDVRRMANGRLRVVSRVGSATSLTVTFRALTPEQTQTLREWVGRTVLFRDVLGRKMYGVYFSVDVTDYADRSGHDAQLVLSEVTFSEAA